MLTTTDTTTRRPTRTDIENKLIKLDGFVAALKIVRFSEGATMLAADRRAGGPAHTYRCRGPSDRRAESRIQWSTRR